VQYLSAYKSRGCSRAHFEAFVVPTPWPAGDIVSQRRM
jgi:hypothetical protein